jgi:hypothetical protein
MVIVTVRPTKATPREPRAKGPKTVAEVFAVLVAATELPTALMAMTFTL